MGEAAVYGLVGFAFCCLAVGVVGLIKPRAMKVFRITSRPKASLAIIVGGLCLTAGVYLKADIERAEMRLAAERKVAAMLRASRIETFPCKILIGSWKVIGSSVGLMLHFDVGPVGTLVGAVTTPTRKKSWSAAECQKDGKFMTVKTTAPKHITTVFKIILPTQLQVMSMSLDGVLKISRGRNLASGMATYPIVKVPQETPQ